MSGKGFVDLLHRVDKLSGTAASGNTTNPPILPMVGKSFDQIQRDGNVLFRNFPGTPYQTLQQKETARQDADSDMQAALILGSHDTILPRINHHLAVPADDQRLDIQEQSSMEIGGLGESDLESHLRNEREKILMSLIEESFRAGMEEAQRSQWDSKVQQWEEYKGKVFNKIQSVDFPSSNQPKETTYTQPDGMRRSNLSEVEMGFAKQMRAYTAQMLAGGMEPKVVDVLGDYAVGPSSSKTYKELWEQVKWMCEKVSPRGSDVATRTSTKHRLSVIDAALTCLEKQFVDHMNITVFENLDRARLGGVPGTVVKIAAYLNVKMPNVYTEMEDGLIDERYPVWAVLYFCLRAGDRLAAVETVEKAGHKMREFVVFFKEYAQRSGNQLAPDTEKKLRLIYSRSARNSSDPFKRAVMCILAPCDVVAEFGEIADKLEDWLWLKLVQCRHEERRLSQLQTKDPRPPTESAPLESFQIQLLQEYGESPLVYWTALWLTGQYEAALEYLFRQSTVLRAYAVHISLAVYKLGLLATPSDLKAPLMSSEKSDPKGFRRLNLPRMIMLYTSSFETSDSREVLNYYYFLKDFKNSSGENLFVVSVSNLVMKTKEYAMLLGYRGPDGFRQPGLVDRYPQLDVGALVDFIAEEMEKKGQTEDAVLLYDLADKHGKVVSLLSRLLSDVAPQVSAPESSRDRICRLALEIATRYRTQGEIGSDGSRTFFLLLDIVTFFDLYHAERGKEALVVMETLGQVPMLPTQVDGMINNFHMVPDEVRCLLADILVGVMTILGKEYEELAAASRSITSNREFDKAIQEIQAKAKSLIMYAGLVPYRLPTETHGRLVQLGSSLN